MHIGRAFAGLCVAVPTAVAFVSMSLPSEDLLVGALSSPAEAVPEATFVNWETPHVSPIAMTPDGLTLLAVNTAGNSLEVFDLGSGSPVHADSLEVGIDPVSVRARSNGEAWVVNHVSDSISVVDLASMRVVRTILTDDEPADVVFAGSPERAFVSCSQVNRVQVFDPGDPNEPLATIEIEGEDPRALAVSPDGNTVYAAIFESGNGSTILGGGLTLNGGNAYPPNVVNNPNGPYGGENPPPNDGNAFSPPIDGNLPTPLEVGLIVKKDEQGRWMDDNGGDWSQFVTGNRAAQSGRRPGWDLVDQDLAVIDASGLSVQYATRLMNACMAMGVNPATGEIAIVGTDATNEIRFEPNLNGRFLRVNAAIVDPQTFSSSIVDLNPHLSYPAGPDFDPIPQEERDMSLGDPRGVVFESSGQIGYVTGMGSNSVIVVDASANRVGPGPGGTVIPVGEGPTGLVLDEARAQLYVMNKFDGSISVVGTLVEAEIERVAFFDPTPISIKLGRPHFYNTNLTSGLGHMSCASCHIDARFDRIGWDLGSPAGEMKAFDQNCLDNGCEDWHPMKGPMTTQTLQDIIGHEPHHWRADRFGLEEFSGAFIGLLGDDVTLTDDQMQEFEDFLATIHFPPNPFREFDNSLPTDMELDGHFTIGRFQPAGQPLPNGNAVRGLTLYRGARLDGVNCVTCHTLPTGMGMNGFFRGLQFIELPPGPNGEEHHGAVSVDGSTNISIKIPQTRNMHEKAGFNATQLRNTAGFGYLHDGSVDSIERFIGEPVFSLDNVQELADLTAFMLSFSGSELPQGSPTNPLEPPGPLSKDAHAAVGQQLTLDDFANATQDELDRLQAMLDEANTGTVGLVAKGAFLGERRGFLYTGGSLYQSDRLGQVFNHAVLTSLIVPDSELTFTVVAPNTAQRIGIDRDQDGFLDRDELDACADPSDALSTPDNSTCCPADIDGDGDADAEDFFGYLDLFASGDDAADIDEDGDIDAEDFFGYLDLFVQPCD